MPVKRCVKDGIPGWKWGDVGFCYTGDGAKEQASAQGRAIEGRKSGVDATIAKALKHE